MNRALDVTLACLGIVAFAPIAALIAVAVKLESRGPVVFVQERLGKDQKPFRCLKFRTMRHDAVGEAWTVADDPRVTGIGRLLRAIHLDELPQLINVVKGEMSIVGPRPLVEREAALFGALIYPYSRRFSVRPGITGLAQITVAPDAHRAKFRLDVFYVTRRSLRLDLTIILRTALKLIRLQDGTKLPQERVRKLPERSQA